MERGVAWGASQHKIGLGRSTSGDGDKRSPCKGEPNKLQQAVNEAKADSRAGFRSARRD